MNGDQLRNWVDVAYLNVLFQFSQGHSEECHENLKSHLFRMFLAADLKTFQPSLWGAQNKVLRRLFQRQESWQHWAIGLEQREHWDGALNTKYRRKSMAVFMGVWRADFAMGPFPATNTYLIRGNLHQN
jgi:hypothetical protein